jgi:RNA polymerase I-specific transcription initiation factor RRN5
LKLKTWLELSERIFMNPAAPREHENWRSFVTEDGETPSIRYTAFADFYTLAVSITQRLVQATLFFAMSRLRSTDSKTFGRKPLVKTKDVYAATKVLGLKQDSKEVWRGAARRCGLRVYQRVSQLRMKTDATKPLSYDEVEAALSSGKNSGLRMEGSTSDFAPTVGGIGFLEDSNEDATLGPAPSSSPSAGSSDPWSGDEGEPESEASIHTALESLEAIETSSSETTTHASEDLYANALDHQASLVEENSLWSLLGQPPPFPLNLEEVELPPRPKYQRKRREELVDWRDKVGYRTEWEMMGPAVGKRGRGVSGLGKRGRDEGSEEEDSGAESE